MLNVKEIGAVEGLRDMARDYMQEKVGRYYQSRDLGGYRNMRYYTFKVLAYNPGMTYEYTALIEGAIKPTLLRAAEIAWSVEVPALLGLIKVGQ